MTEIQLGDKVKCIHTGFTGTVLARTEFLNGCIQYTVAAKWDGKTTEVTEVGIDEGSLEVVKPIRKKQKKEENGGAMRKSVKMRGY